MGPGAAKQCRYNSVDVSLSAGSHDLLDWNQLTRHALARRATDSSRVESSTIEPVRNSVCEA